MFEHLFDPQFDDLTELSVTETLSAQANTTAWLESIGAKSPTLSSAQKQLARDAFAAVTDPTVPTDTKKDAVLALRVPPAVRHLSEMLVQYDWDYVERAKEIRGKVVAGLLEETSHPDARIRLKSLELLGKLTEVGSFTERIEIKKVDVSHTEILDDIKKYLVLPTDTAEVTEVQPKL